MRVRKRSRLQTLIFVCFMIIRYPDSLVPLICKVCHLTLAVFQFLKLYSYIKFRSLQNYEVRSWQVYFFINNKSNYPTAGFQIHKPKKGRNVFGATKPAMHPPTMTKDKIHKYTPKIPISHQPTISAYGSCWVNGGG